MVIINFYFETEHKDIKNLKSNRTSHSYNICQMSQSNTWYSFIVFFFQQKLIRIQYEYFNCKKLLMLYNNVMAGAKLKQQLWIIHENISFMQKNSQNKSWLKNWKINN